MRYLRFWGNGMIYNKSFKFSLILLALLNICIVSIGVKLGVFSAIVFIAFIIEIIIILYEIRKHKNIARLLQVGEVKHLSADDIIYTTKMVTNRTGYANMHINVQTSSNYKNGYYKGFISIPYTCYQAFQEALTEIGVEIRIDPENTDNYYMCLENVAAYRWIPNSCNVEKEKKITIWFWIIINIIIMSGAFLL